MEHLEFITVQELERTIRHGGASHREGALRILRKWALEPGLKCDPETRRLLIQLAAEFLPSGQRRRRGSD
jgi:hypothetical protein